MVAIKAQGAAAFVKAPDPKIPAILLFGSDPGMVSERAGMIAKTVAGRDNPPGEIIRIEEGDLDNDPDRLAVELQTMPMFGGRKVVRTSSGRRINAQYLKPLVEGGQLAGTLIVEAGSLRPDESLRVLFEKSPFAAAIACYADEEAGLEGLIRDMLKQARMDIAPEARDLLVARLGADRVLSRNEIQKLTLYASGKSRIEVDDVEAVVGDAAELALDRVVMAATSGDTARALIEIDRAVASGDSPQGVVMAAQRYVHRLHRLRAAVDAGRSLDDTIRSFRPPMPPKVQAGLRSHCQMWTLQRLNEAESRIAAAVKDARLGGGLEQALSERLLIEISRLARMSAADQKRGR
jgi:DNA polymerase-3 subunit delta